MNAKKTLSIVLIGILSFTVFPATQTDAQILEIIKAATIKVIKAFDLMIQRIQTKTIWLQNAQKVLENKLSQLKLSEIAQWTQKQRDLYKKYYDELWKVRKAITDLNRVRLITSRQIQLINEYKRSWALVNADKHFTKSELDYMYRVYTGIVNQSIDHLVQLTTIVSSYQTQMSDAKRMQLISQAGDGIDGNYADLKKFNTQNVQLSISRSKDEHEAESIKKLYGIK